MDWGAWLKQAAEYFAREWGLLDAFASKIALFYAYLWSMGLSPRITSGYRDPKKQKAMQEAWDRGDRAGLKFRPATNSDHCKRKAVDIQTSNPREAARIAKLLGIGTGLDYGDEVHFFQKG